EALGSLQLAVHGEGAGVAAVNAGADQLQLARAVDPNGAGAGERVGVEQQRDASVDVVVGAGCGADPGAGDHLDGAVAAEVGKGPYDLEALGSLQLAVNGEGAGVAAVDCCCLQLQNRLVRGVGAVNLDGAAGDAKIVEDVVLQQQAGAVAGHLKRAVVLEMTE